MASITVLKTIRPDDRLRDGTLAAVRQIVAELRLHRGHIATAFDQDFRGLYYGTFFGVVWNVVLPLAPLLLYAMLASRRVIPVFDGVNPASYVVLGATIWFLLAGCVQQPIQVVRARNVEVMKTAMPLSAMVVSGFGQLMFDTVVRFLLVVVIVLITSSPIEWSAVLLPLTLIPAMMLFLGIGLVLSIANVIYGDVSRVVGIILQYGIFLSGVIFPIESLPFSEYLKWNPFYIFIEESRLLVFRGMPQDFLLLGCLSALGLLVLLLGCRVFYVMEYRVRGIA